MNRKFSRRTALGFIAVGAASVLAAACGGPTPTPTAAPKAEAPKPTEAPKPAATTAAAKPTEAPKPTAAAAKPTEAPKAAATPQAAAKSGSSKPVQLSWWFWADDADQAKMYTDVIDKFNQKSERIQVTADFFATNPDQRKKLLTSFAAGAGVPDVTHALNGWMPEFNDAKLPLPMEDRFKTWPTYAEWLPNIEKLARVRAKDPLVFVPNQVMISYLYYRADWLAEAKLQPPDTLDELLNVARSLTKAPDRYGYGFRGGDSGGLSQQLSHYLKGNGVEIVKEDGNVDLDSPDGIATVDWYVSLYTKHKVTQPSAVTDRFPELFAGLQGGKLALMHHGLWSFRVQEKALGEKVASVQIPKGSKTRYVDTFLEGEILPATTKQRDEAWELIRYLCEPDQMRVFSAQRGAGPVAKSMLDDKIYKDNRFYKAAMASQPYWGSLPSYHKNWVKMTDRYTPEMQRLLKGEIKPDQFCKTLADVLRKG